MKNFALYFAGFFFTMASIIQIIRYSLKSIITINSFTVPVTWSLYVANILAIIALWMFLTALKRH